MGRTATLGGSLPLVGAVGRYSNLMKESEHASVPPSAIHALPSAHGKAVG